MGILRKVMIEARNRIEGREIRNTLIKEAFLKEYSSASERFFIYASYNGEADTMEIMKKLLESGKEVFCPKTLGRDIAFFRISSLAELAPGYHSIPEPVLPELTEDVLSSYIAEHGKTPEAEDLMVIPGLVFDEEGGRFGYGSGMYDRYLSEHPCKKVALAYEMQVRRTPLELTETDVKMDALITESRVRVFS